MKVRFTDGYTVVSDEFAVTVSGANIPPSILSHTCVGNPTEDSLYSCNVTVNDPNPVEIVSLNFDALNTCGWASVSGSYPTYTISGTPDNSHVGSCDLRLVRCALL